MKKSFAISGCVIVAVAVVLVVYPMMPVMTSEQQYFGSWQNSIVVGGNTYMQIRRFDLYDNKIGDVIDVTVKPPQNYNGPEFDVYGFIFEGNPQSVGSPASSPVQQWSQQWRETKFSYAPNYPTIEFLFTIQLSATVPSPFPQWSFAYVRTSHMPFNEQLPYLISAGSLFVVGIVLIAVGFLSGEKTPATSSSTRARPKDKRAR